MILTVCIQTQTGTQSNQTGLIYQSGVYDSYSMYSDTEGCAQSNQTGLIYQSGVYDPYSVYSDTDGYPV